MFIPARPLTTIAALLTLAQPALAGQGADEWPSPAAMNCLTCHSTGARAGSGELPSLAGLPAATILERLLGFRDGERDATIMRRITRAYTPAELERIAGEMAALLP